MKRAVVIFCFCLSLGVGSFSPGLSRPTSTLLSHGPLDSYGNICWEDEKARLDNFAIYVRQNPGWDGFIVVHAGRRSCTGEAQARLERAKKWVVEERGVEANRVILKDGGYQEDVTTKLWLLPPGLSESERPVAPSLKADEVKVIAKCKGKIYKPAKCNNP